MKIFGQIQLSNKANSIPGWFSQQDHFIFKSLLNHQQELKAKGNLLEIGVYLGKSAVVLGAQKRSDEEVVVCDLFQGDTDSLNSKENTWSYSDLTRQSFEKNYTKTLGELPRILECSSLSLWAELPKEKFRFIHVDGSHLYDLVKSDLDFAINALIPKGGIIVMDDFRAQHTLGVSKSLWESIMAKKVSPIIFSAAKVYLVRFGDDTYNSNDLKGILLEGGFETESLDMFPSRPIRVLGLSDSDLYNRNSKLTWWVPPVLLPFFRRIRTILLRQ